MRHWAFYLIRNGDVSGGFKQAWKEFGVDFFFFFLGDLSP